MPQSHHDLEGRHVLVVEDEYYIAADMVDALEEHGAHVIGPAASIADAIHLVEQTEHLDGAVVDLNLRGELAFPVARALAARHVPFVFATGYDAETIPMEFRHIIRCEKPVDFMKVAHVLFA
jgi:CheY-like chemotaxis protein